MTVTEVNDAPVATDDAVTMRSTSNATNIDVLDNDTDTEGGILTVSSPSITSGDTGGTISTAGTYITYTPSAGYTGSSVVSYTITDDGTTNGSNDFLTDTANLTITVVAVSNAAPVASNDAASTTEDSGQITIDALANDTDADADSLTIATVSTSGTGTVSTDGSEIRYTPAANFNGTETLTYIVSDSEDGIDGLDTGTVTVTVTEVNDAPVTANPATATTDENTPLTVTVTTDTSYVTDVETNTLTFTNYSVTSTNSGGSDGTVQLSSDGTGLVFTPSGEGPYSATISYSLVDNGTTNGAPDPQSVNGQLTVSVTGVNDAPVPGADAGTIAEDATATAFTVLSNDTDAENDTLVVSAPTIVFGDTSGMVTTNGTTVAYTPSANFNGTTRIEYTVTDDGTTNGVNDFQTATGTLTVTVTTVNDAPVVSAATDTIEEDASQQSYPVTGSSLYASDVDVDALTITSATLTGDTTGSIDFSDGANLKYTPGADFNGVATITYTLTDNGTTNGSNDFLTDTGTLTITVTAVPDAPIASSSTTYTGAEITEDAANITITLVDSNSLIDADGDQLQLFTLTLDNGGSYVINYDGNGNWDGTVTYTPSANFAGNELFSYAVTDGTDVVNLTLTVPVAIGTNDAPVTTPDTASVAEDTQASTEIAVLSNDTDPENDSLTVTSVVVTNSSAQFGAGPGTVSTDGTQVLYTPAAGFVGTETITYTVTDDGTSNAVSDPLSSTGTVTVAVTNVNDAPVITDPANDTTPEGTAVTVAVATDTAYVTDPESDTITVTSANISSGDTSGTVAIDGTTGIIYTPSADFNGTVVINYTVTDDGTTDGATDPLTAAGTLTISVTADAVNAGPAANDDTQTLIEDAATTAIDVLSNDTDADTSDTLTIITVTTAGTGTVSTDGSYLYYTPARDFAGTELVSYTIQDDDQANNGAGSLTDTATLTVTVLGQDDPPAVSSTPDPDVTANSTVSITLFDSLVDSTDGDTISVLIIGANSGGTVVDNGDGTITYTPAAGYTGDEVISYQVTDSTGQVTTATITITVGVNSEPVVDSTASTTVLENSTNNAINIMANVTDADVGDTVTITTINGNRGGTATVGANGTSVSYAPANGFDGEEVLTFTVTDGTNTVTGFHTVIVTNVDETAPTVSQSFPTTYAAGINNSLNITIIGATDGSGNAYITDDSSTLYVRLVGQPSYGIATTDGRSISYRSYATAVSSLDDSITFEIFDGTNATRITIVINLVPANVGTCSPSAVSLADPTLSDGCTIEPTGYRIPVHLFGLCTADPTAPTTASSYDLSSCSFFFDGRASGQYSTVTFGSVNERTAYSGAVSLPAYGTYTHGVMLVGTNVEMKGSLFLSGSSTPYCVTGDYAENIRCFASDVPEAFVDDDPITFLYESGVYSYDFSDDNVSVYLVDDSGLLVNADGAGSKILAVQEFSSAKSFTAATRQLDVQLGISDALILNNGEAKAAPFKINFTLD